jgi:hypothetical protein
MRVPQRTLRFVISGLLAVSLLVFDAGSAGADYYWGHYISSNDPVNLIFDVNGTWTNSLYHVNAYLGWTDRGGSNQQFPDHSSQPWESQNFQHASNCLACHRDHIRYNQGNDWGGPVWGTWTMGPVHYEEIDYWCARHRTVTFNGARDHVKGTFGNIYGHPTGYVRINNTAPAPQCDGSTVAGDGYYGWIDIY